MKFRLKELCVKYNVVQNEVSKSTGINKNAISSYANNTMIHIPCDHIDKLCAYFKCNINKLIVLDDNKEDSIESCIITLILEGKFDNIIKERIDSILKEGLTFNKI